MWRKTIKHICLLLVISIGCCFNGKECLHSQKVGHININLFMLWPTIGDKSFSFENDNWRHFFHIVTTYLKYQKMVLWCINIPPPPPQPTPPRLHLLRVMHLAAAVVSSKWIQHLFAQSKKKHFCRPLYLGEKMKIKNLCRRVSEMSSSHMKLEVVYCWNHVESAFSMCKY